MPGHDRDEWVGRIKGVEREYLAARYACDLLLAEVRRNPSALPAGFRVRDVNKMADGLEGTYLIRLFAAFEAGLRTFWSVVRDTVPPTRDLMNGIAAMRRVDDSVRDDAHTVREYRNSLVHEVDDSVAPVPLAVARHHLCSFFGRLPRKW